MAYFFGPPVYVRLESRESSVIAVSFMYGVTVSYYWQALLEIPNSQLAGMYVYMYV